MNVLTKILLIYSLCLFSVFLFGCDKEIVVSSSSAISSSESSSSKSISSESSFSEILSSSNDLSKIDEELDEWKSQAASLDEKKDNDLVFNEFPIFDPYDSQYESYIPPASSDYDPLEGFKTE